MRVVLAVGTVLMCCAAQVQTPPAGAPARDPEAGESEERPLLENTGKPMVVEYRCGDDDIRAAGLTCTREDPCPLYLELSSVEAVGDRIFLAGNIHTSSTTLASVLLASDDIGKTWREPHERIRDAGLDAIQFIDFQNGWASGGLLRPLPHDPFLLITSDGGRAWRAHPIFAEPRFGFIQQFWFSTRNNGSMVIDRGQAGESGRYELYETPNAGESWTLRQSSEHPLQMKRTGGAANADWRLRADATTKSYRVERHAGDRWHAMASFAVSIGGCAPPEAPAGPSGISEPVGGVNPSGW